MAVIDFLSPLLILEADEAIKTIIIITITAVIVAQIQLDIFNSSNILPRLGEIRSFLSPDIKTKFKQSSTFLTTYWNFKTTMQMDVYFSLRHMLKLLYFCMLVLFNGG